MTSEKTHDEWVIPNSDKLYHKKTNWTESVETKEINSYEIDILKGTLNPLELVKAEKEEKVEELTTEELNKKKIKEYISMFKIICLDDMGFKPFYNIKYFNKKESNIFMSLMEDKMKEYNDGHELDIRNKFYSICNEKLFNSKSDVSQYSIGT